ncbi:SDR family NAD(P)-dependent oxidoreductase [Pseudohoeflea coraliihabitans]|uniref:SDR family oxidoreductase n=1 Tax=Pseudohoeflea coraliihabitans TaxID=2860393 RepID=A0ABS6WT58_9HYPH|nr:SDR family oxidoreductase [Pseudohoeflea sp. DP4N28-3]
MTGTVDGHVVVTGGAAGIGAATVAALLDEGAAVTVLDADGNGLAALEDRHEGEDLLALSCDVSDEDEVADCLDQAADTLGPITGLVCAAAIPARATAEKTSVELFRQIIDINLTGTFIVCRAVLDRMGEDLAIVTLAAASGLRANHGHVAYGASKAGVVLMTQVLANEWGASGVRVNAVAPGIIGAADAGHSDNDEYRRWLARTPMRRGGTPDDVAGAILFLLSDEAGYINGHVLSVDGGFASAGLLQDL